MFFTASTIGLGYPLSSNLMFNSSPSTSALISYCEIEPSTTGFLRPTYKSQRVQGAGFG